MPGSQCSHGCLPRACDFRPKSGLSQCNLGCRPARRFDESASFLRSQPPGFCSNTRQALKGEAPAQGSTSVGFLADRWRGE